MRLPRELMPAVIALAVFVALLGVLAVPNVLTARQRYREKRTMADMRTLAIAMEARAMHTSSYDFGPAPAARVGSRVEQFDTLHRVSHAELRRALVPKYIKTLPLQDGWGSDFDVRVGDYKKGVATLYAIRSFGSDRRADGRVYEAGTKTKFSEDIIFSDGNFIRYPEGI